MRIVVVAPPWVPVPPPAYGGTEAVLDTLARTLHGMGHDVLLVTTGDSTCPVPKASVFDEALGVGRNGSAAEIRHVYRAYEAARTFEADIVHDHTLVGPLHAAQHPNLAVVTTNHGPFGDDLADVYRAVAGRVPVLAISHDQASRAVDVPVEAVIHHGLTVDDYPLGTGTGDYALFLGRMHPDKGVHVACRVARRAGLRLVIAARMQESIERDYFDTLVRPQLGARIEYVGEADAGLKRELLGAATCLLNPIQWPEPFGMVMIEAMACGTPVVARPVGAAPEIVVNGVTGILGDSEAELAAGLERAGSLARDRCRHVVARRFSARRMTEGHLVAYESVRAQHASTARTAAA